MSAQVLSMDAWCRKCGRSVLRCQCRQPAPVEHTRCPHGYDARWKCSVCSLGYGPDRDTPHGTMTGMTGMTGPGSAIAAWLDAQFIGGVINPCARMRAVWTIP